MAAVYSPSTGLVRVFDGDSTYGDAYTTVLTVHHLTEDTVYISGAHGKLSGGRKGQIFDELRSHGWTTLYYHRDGQLVKEEI